MIAWGHQMRQLRMKLRHSIIGIVLSAPVLFAPLLRAQDGLPGALARVGRTSYAWAELSSPIAAADFDNDQKPDGAILQATGFLNGSRAFRIELHLSAGNNDAISFSSSEPDLSISALDVNQDGAPDILIEKALTHERLEVYLNDGHGAFHRARTEDYPLPNQDAPDGRKRQLPVPSASCLPPSRGLEPGDLKRISTLRRDTSGPRRSWLEILLAPSKPRAPTSSRAPPSLLSL